MRSTAVVGANTTASRILGFIRDVVIARTFGAALEADAFFVAFRIPNFLRRMFGEGAFSQAFVPVLSEYKETRSEDAVRELSAHVAAVLGGVLFVVTAIGVVAAPLLIIVFAPGFFVHHSDKYALASEMLRITFPYLLFISLTALAAGVLNTYGRFAVPAFTPVLLNVCLIGAALWVAPHLDQPIMALAWAVLAAGVVQLGFQLPFLQRLRLLTWPRYRRRHEGGRRIMKLILPALFGVSVSQINLLVDTLIASFLMTGSISWLYYADRLVELPVGVFGIALGTVILPSLSRKHVAAHGAAFSDTLDWALRLVLLIGLPAATGLAVLAAPILSTLFQYGEFAEIDVQMATLSLTAYALGLIGFVGIKVLAPGFYARQDTRTPVRIGVIAMVSNMFLNVIFVFPFGHAGLALATSASAFLNAGLLLLALRRAGVYRPGDGWRRFGRQVLAADLVMATVLWLASDEVSAWIGWGISERVLHLAILLVAGAGIYFLVLFGTGLRMGALVPPAGK